MLQETRSIQRLFSSLFNNKNMNFMKKKKTLSLSLTAHYSGRQLQFFHVDTRFLCLGRLRIIALSLLQSNKSIQIKSEPLIASSLRTRMNDVRHQGILGFDHQRCAVTAEADSPRSTAESPWKRRRNTGQRVESAPKLKQKKTPTQVTKSIPADQPSASVHSNIFFSHIRADDRERQQQLRHSFSSWCVPNVLNVFPLSWTLFESS